MLVMTGNGVSMYLQDHDFWLAFTILMADAC
jgi:hypothetical protein